MSLSIAAHELIYTADHAGGSGRLHHLAWFVDTREECLRAADLFVDADVPIEAAPSKHAVAQGMFLYVYEPGRQPRGGHHRHPLHLRPRVSSPIRWTEAERARGQAWGVKTIATFHTYGTPPLDGTVGPPIPPTSADAAPPAPPSHERRRAPSATWSRTGWCGATPGTGSALPPCGTTTA